MVGNATATIPLQAGANFIQLRVIVVFENGVVAQPRDEKVAKLALRGVGHVGFQSHESVDP